MANWIKVYMATLIVYAGLDYIWLGHVASRFYKNELGEQARRVGDALNPVLWSAGVVYLIVPIAILVFVLPRVQPENVVGSSLLHGFVFGAIVYGVYNLTNYAILEKWPIKMSLIDIGWGGVVCALLTLAAAKFDRMLS